MNNKIFTIFSVNYFCYLIIVFNKLNTWSFYTIDKNNGHTIRLLNYYYIWVDSLSSVNNVHYLRRLTLNYNVANRYIGSSINK